MESVLLIALPLVLIISCWVLSQRDAELERRIDALTLDRIEPIEITRIIRRITQLELSLAELRAAPVAVPAGAPPFAPPPEPEAPPPPIVVAAPTAAEAPIPEPAPIASPAAASPALPGPSPEALPEPVLAAFSYPAPASPRPKRTSEEWEAIVGGNWLNKLGILVLVIGLALFLGYSFTRMGPAGRATVALALSASLLAAGVLLERRASYAVFARGLLAGGWAALYFTTYAMHAVDAAKVIESPLIGGLLLLAVAAGMVAHSLKYRSQTLTALAYFMAFTTLAITPVTSLSVAALIPLAGSLLVVAWRFRWSNLPLLGLIATYATCASRTDTGAPLASTQAVFAAYWLLFEAYDLLRARRASNQPAERAILPLNALGLTLLSFAKWSSAAPAQLYLLAAGIAVAYLASTILRAKLRPPSSFPEDTTTLERILAGGFEGPVTLAAAASACAAALQLHGQTVTNVLLSEAEILFVAGLVFHQTYLRRLAGTLFAALGWQLLSADLPSTGSVQFLGLTLRDWTPSALFACLLFYTNRSRRAPANSPGVYAYAASALLALTLGFEVPLRYLGISWLAFAALLFLFGLRFRLFDFRLQGYSAALLALGAMAVYQIQIAAGLATPSPYAWISLSLATLAAYALSLCALRTAPERLTATELSALPLVASWTATATAAALLWRTVPPVYLGPAWIALGILALELGLRRLPPDLRIPAHLIALFGALHVAFFAVLPPHTIVLTSERIAIGFAALFAYAFAARLFFAEYRHASVSRNAAYLASAGGSLFTLIEVWALVGPLAVAPVWAALALALVGVGLRLELPGLRLQGHAVAAAGFFRLCNTNLPDASSIHFLSGRICSGAIVIAAHYTEWWRQSRAGRQLLAWEDRVKRAYLYTAAFLIAALLFLELPPQFVAAGWAGFTLALLIAGFRWNQPDLRYQSYALALFAFTRTLDLEFHSAQLFASQAQRVAAGAGVIACLFAAQLFCPRKSQEHPPTPGNPRLCLSLLATALTTAFLFHEVTGSMLTVAWGIQGAFLLGAGFPLRDRTLRLSGLAVFVLCIGKLFFYDLSALDTLYRILSFFVLGVILVAVSWIYTRFRESIRQYL